MHWKPCLPTATKDAYELGKKAFDVLLARIQNPDIPRQQVHIQARVILRESTGLAPSSIEG